MDISLAWAFFFLCDNLIIETRSVSIWIHALFKNGMDIDCKCFDHKCGYTKSGLFISLSHNLDKKMSLYYGVNASQTVNC